MVKDSVKQLTKEDLYRAKAISLFAEEKIIVEMPDEYPYYERYPNSEWNLSDKFDEYMDSSLMMSYLRKLSPEEAIRILEEWDERKK